MAVAPTSSTDQRVQFEAQVQAMMRALGDHESSMDYQQHHKPGSHISASGAYQYTDGTWNNYKGYAHAWQAPPSVQDERMHADIVNRWNHYHDWTKVIVAHFYPEWANHPERWGESPTADQPGLHNPTMNDYIKDVSGRFNHYSTGAPIPPVQRSVTGHAGGVSSGGQQMTSSIAPDGTISYAAGSAAVTGLSGEPEYVPGQATKPTAQQVHDYALKNYGYLAYFLDIPEVNKKIMEAVANGWSPQTLLGALSQTKWYTTLSDQERAWDYLVKSNNGTALAAIADQSKHLVTEARQMGFTLDAGRAKTLATSLLRLGKQGDAEYVRGVVGAEYHYVAPVAGKPDTGNIGLAGTSIDQFKKMSQDYLVPLSDSTLSKWTQLVLEGKQSAGDFEHYVKGQAKALHPDLAAQIDAGHTTRELYEPYLNVISQELEVPVASLDLWDKSTMKYLTPAATADAKGKTTMAMPTLSEVQTMVRQDPRYKATSGALDKAATLAETIDKTFGKVG